MTREMETWNLLTEAQTMALKVFLREAGFSPAAARKIRQAAFINGARGALRQLQRELIAVSNDPVWRYQMSRLRPTFDEHGNLIFIGPERIREWLETEDAGPMGPVVRDWYELEDDYVSVREFDE